MSTPTANQAPPGGYGTTLRAVLHAALLTGLLLGLVDGLRLALEGGARLGLVDRLGCTLGGVAVYVGATLALLLVLSPLVHLRARGGSLGRRTLLAFGWALAAALFLNVYWWSRPYVFYGRSSVAPERLAATAAMALACWGGGVLLARRIARLPGAARLALELAALGSVLVGGLYLAVATSGPADRGALTERTRERPNVLLVIVDALRADVLGAYGNERVQTPVIDGLARRGVVFENAQVQAPYTWTSFGSILTGKYPRRHGLMKMKPGVRMRPNATLAWHLKGAELDEGGALAPSDYASGSFMTGTLSHGSGLARGFDVYFEALVGHDLVDTEVPWSVFRSDLLLFHWKNKLTQRFDSGLVVTTAEDWLRENRGRRFAAMVHLYSTHTPYDPLPEYRELYVDPAYDGPIPAFYAEHRIAIEEGKYDPTPADVEQIRNLYYGGTTQADAAIGDVLATLASTGALEDTIVIVTADHGEELADHMVNGQALWEHNWMYETNLRVPLVMSWPGGLPEGLRVEELVETVDLLPTLCDLMGLELPAEARGLDPAELATGGDGARGHVDGRSLVPLLRGEPVVDTRPFAGHAFAENGRFLSIRDARWKLIVQRDGLDPEAFAADLAADPASGRRPRLFDLKADPGELTERIDDARPEAERLLAVLRAWSDTMPVPVYDVVSSHRDLEDEQMLGALGYGEGIGYEGPEGDGHDDH